MNMSLQELGTLQLRYPLATAGVLVMQDRALTSTREWNPFILGATQRAIQKATLLTTDFGNYILTFSGGLVAPTQYIRDIIEPTRQKIVNRRGLDSAVMTQIQTSIHGRTVEACIEIIDLTATLVYLLYQDFFGEVHQYVTQLQANMPPLRGGSGGWNFFTYEIIAAITTYLFYYICADLYQQYKLYNPAIVIWVWGWIFVISECVWLAFANCSLFFIKRSVFWYIGVIFALIMATPFVKMFGRSYSFLLTTPIFLIIHVKYFKLWIRSIWYNINYQQHDYVLFIAKLFILLFTTPSSWIAIFTILVPIITFPNVKSLRNNEIGRNDPILPILRWYYRLWDNLIIIYVSIGGIFVSVFDFHSDSLYNMFIYRFGSRNEIEHRYFNPHYCSMGVVFMLTKFFTVSGGQCSTWISITRYHFGRLFKIFDLPDIFVAGLSFHFILFIYFVIYSWLLDPQFDEKPLLVTRQTRIKFTIFVSIVISFVILFKIQRNIGILNQIVPSKEQIVLPHPRQRPRRRRR